MELSIIQHPINIIIVVVTIHYVNMIYTHIIVKTLQTQSFPLSFRV